MDDKEPVSRRDLCYLIFPRWVVDYLLAPFPDESGWGLVIFRWVLEGTTLAFLVIVFVPDQLLLPLIVGGIWALIALLILYVTYSRSE